MSTGDSYGHQQGRTKSLAVARITDRTGCQWPSRSSNVNDFI